MNRLRRANPLPEQLEAPAFGQVLDRLDDPSALPENGPARTVRATAGSIISLAAASLAAVAIAVAAIAVFGHSRTSNTTTKPAGGDRMRPRLGQVPAGFEPFSVTAIDSRTWWVLGSRPCSPRPCAAIVRTADGGKHFASIPAPSSPISLGPAEQPPGVSQVRFANPRDGFAYSSALWVTHDRGASWRRLDLAVTHGSRMVQ
jgi:hypothetical protein